MSIKITPGTREIVTPQSQEAVNRIKNSIRKVNIIPNFLEKTPTKDMLERRKYMTSKAFWNDTHNKKMNEISKELVGIIDGTSPHNWLVRTIREKLITQAKQVK